MQKWEYEQVDATLPDSNLYKLLESYGDDGWELVSVVKVVETDLEWDEDAGDFVDQEEVIHTFIFKRPKQG